MSFGFPQQQSYYGGGYGGGYGYSNPAQLARPFDYGSYGFFFENGGLPGMDNRFQYTSAADSSMINLLLFNSAGITTGTRMTNTGGLPGPLFLGFPFFNPNAFLNGQSGQNAGMYPNSLGINYGGFGGGYGQGYGGGYGW